jgi:Bacterial Ig domain
LTQADEDFCPRTITFTIPGHPGVQVTAVEEPSMPGSIHFTVDVLGDADLRGLFFHLADETKLNGLAVTDEDGNPVRLITNFVTQEDSVINLGQGAEMNAAASPFDVGIRWGSPGPNPDDFINFPVDFFLSNTAHNLTLDDIAHVEFGARLDAVKGPDAKITTIAPAAPDAHDDTATTHEDTSVTINVLANDIDLDGDTLTITSVHLESGAHGTAVIAADGQSFTYTPDKDYAGTNFDLNSVDATFEYCVSDGDGGQDSAKVDVHIIPVADQPTITFDLLPADPNDPINMVRLKVTAAQSDADGSEFIDRIEFGAVPPGVQLIPDGNLNPSDQPGSVEAFVQLILPTAQDANFQDLNFDLNVTAYSQEKGNGDPDEASVTAAKHIEVDFNHNQTEKDFLAEHQSIWSTGNAFSVDEHPFVGPNVPLDYSTPFPIELPPFVLKASSEGYFKTGLQVDIHLEGGAIDAHLPFDITVDTTYNKTTDSLLIQTGAELAPGATFTTTGPEGEVSLKYILDFFLKLSLEDPLDFGIGLSKTFSLQPDPINLLPFPVSSTSPDLPYTVPLPAGLSITFDWPHLSVQQEDQSGNMVSGDGASNNFIQLNADVDLAAATLFPLFAPIEAVLDPDPLDPNNFELLDLDVNGGANFLQKFVLNALGLDGTITFETGDQETFHAGEALPIIRNASSLDGPDAGANIDFTLSLTPHVTLQNTTSIGFNIGGQLGVLKNIPVIDDSLFNQGITIPIASIPLDTTDPFDLHFNSQGYDLFV